MKWDDIKEIEKVIQKSRTSREQKKNKKSFGSRKEVLDRSTSAI